MLDTNRQLPALSPASWQTRLAPGFIVRFRFPLWDLEGGPDMPRPCLVVGVAEIDGRRFATLVCGSHRHDLRATADAFTLSDPASLWAAGLTQPLRFRFARTITVSLDNMAFVRAEGGSPVIGRLSGEDFARLLAARARPGARPGTKTPRRGAPDRRRSRSPRRRPWRASGPRR